MNPICVGCYARQSVIHEADLLTELLTQSGGVQLLCFGDSYREHQPHQHLFWVFMAACSSPCLTTASCASLSFCAQVL